MKTTLNIPDELINEVMTISSIKTKTEAVIAGLKELIRQKKIEKVLSSLGKINFSDEIKRARHER
ncbi:type II toxin-antitoxin system VapB family antitoxin [Candidatus Poribacteria bacterium]|nr:type II toxin-antitoxin system VapB family antitoxin [Candidatus Poribacteria bacterium]